MSMDRPEVMRAAVARLKVLFSANGIDRIPADSILFHAATDMLALERDRCAAVCDEYSKRLIATGAANTPSEWQAHGAEACSNLIKGWNEFGDPPESRFFRGAQ